MRCPSCGMAIDADRRYAVLAVCASCGGSVVLDEKAARLTGKMAVLAETASPLYVGATGSLRKRPFTVLGRVRYGYARGFWDEWYLRLDNGKTAWISEDEGNLALEVLEDLETPPADYASTQPGATVRIGEVDYHVDEKDIARCEGGEGQLPLVIEQGERIPYLDLSAGELFGTLEFELDGSGARLFQGRRLDSADLIIDFPREAAGGAAAPSGERAGDDASRERVVRRDDRAQALNCNCCGAPLPLTPGAKSVECAHCGTEVEVTARRVTCGACNATLPVYGHLAAKTMVCPKCGTQSDITGREPTLLEAVAAPDRPPSPFRMGQRGTLRGMDCVIVGRLRFRERDEGKDYYSDEYLLHCQQVGYRWLVMENGHFSLTEELDDRPTGVSPAHISPGHRFTFQGAKYRVFERGKCELIWVEGEMPWVAKVGDKNRYMDATAPPLLLTAEWTESEQEWYRAVYLPRAEVAQAFGLPLRDLPPRTGIAPHEQFSRSPFRKQAMAIVGIFALVFSVLAGHAALTGGTPIGSFTLNGSDYAEEFVTDTFTTTQPNMLCTARFKAPVDNAWVYLEAAVLNDREEALLDFSAEVSYYHGVQGGESWSEGSQRDTKTFKLREAGSYRFLVLGQAGVGESAGSATGGPPVTVTVYEGTILCRYYLVLAVICTIWLLMEGIAQSSFQSRKWSESDVEDD